MSVAMLTYNAEETVEQALRSVMSQQTEFDLEIVVWDDCSTDGTVEKVRAVLEECHWPWRLIVPPSNVQSTGRSPMLEVRKHTTGRYIARLDGDDFWLDPFKLQRQFELLEQHASSVLACSDWVMTTSSGEQTESFSMPGEGPYMPYASLFDGNQICHSSVVYRREILDQLPPSWESLAVSDYALWGVAAPGADILVYRSPATAYRRHDGSSWASLPLGTRLSDEVDAVEWLSTVVAERDLADRWVLRRLLIEDWSARKGVQLRRRHEDVESLKRDREILSARVQELSDEDVASLKRDREILSARVQELSDEERRLRDQIAMSVDREAELNVQIGALAAERDLMAARLSESMELRDNLRALMDDVELEAARTRHMSAQIETALRGELERVKGSASWRVTAPLRRLREMVSRRQVG